MSFTLLEWAGEWASGMYQMNPELYHTLPGISGTGLWDLNRSPLHFQTKRENPVVPTPAMRFGSLFHTACLEPETFHERYIKAPKIDKRTKEGKAAWADFCQSNAGKDPVESDEFDQLCAMIDSVWSNPLSKEFLIGDMKELSLLWRDEVTDAMCRGRPDVILDGGETLVDLKTTDDARAESFVKNVANFGYHLQMSHYADGIYHLTGTQPAGVFFFVVERNPPFQVKVHKASAEMISKGHDRRWELLQTYQRCIMTNEWPGYDDEIVEINLPAWAERA